MYLCLLLVLGCIPSLWHMPALVIWLTGISSNYIALLSTVTHSAVIDRWLTVFYRFKFQAQPPLPALNSKFIYKTYKTTSWNMHDPISWRHCLRKWCVVLAKSLRNILRTKHIFRFYWISLVLANLSCSCAYLELGLSIKRGGASWEAVLQKNKKSLK